MYRDRNEYAGVAIVALLGAGNGCEDVERRDIRAQLPQGVDVSSDAGGGITGEAENVGEVRRDAAAPTELDELAVALRKILRLVHTHQCAPIERLDTDKHLVTAGSSKKRDELGLIDDLRVTLNEEW